MATSDDEVYDEFREAVNMTSRQLEDWLATEESQSVGWTGGSDGGTKSGPGGEESTGHESGRRIVTLIQNDRGDLTADDHDHMRKVVAYVHRHLAQRPDGDVATSRWRYSLMNWGHDPLKD